MFKVTPVYGTEIQVRMSVHLAVRVVTTTVTTHTHTDTQTMSKLLHPARHKLAYLQQKKGSDPKLQSRFKGIGSLSGLRIGGG